MIEKKLTFDKPIYVLAPLAGYTDLPFRSVVKKFGADLTVSEMLSSNALVHGSSKTLGMIQKSPNEDPYSVQIAGAEVDVIRRAVEILNEQQGIDVIDLNCGCPVPKIVSHGSGSSLLLNLPLMGEIIKTIKETSNKNLTSVKIRLGFEKKNHVDIAKIVEDSGADFIAVHGRTRAGKFNAPVDYDAIREIKEAIRIPVIANGDIDSYEKAEWVLEHTGADGVMIGRGAVGAPWIFHQLKHGTKDVDESIKRAIIMEHFDKVIEFHGAHGVAMFRKHMHTYSKGYRGASVLRDKINHVSNPQECRELIEKFLKNSEIVC
jgi:tRNA-dihydrouridine synthase B